MAANAVSGSLKKSSLRLDSLCLCLCLWLCCCLSLPVSLLYLSLLLFSSSFHSRYLASFTCSLNCKRVQQHKTLSRLYLFMGHTWAACYPSPSFSRSPPSTCNCNRQVHSMQISMHAQWLPLTPLLLLLPHWQQLPHHHQIGKPHRQFRLQLPLFT